MLSIEEADRFLKTHLKIEDWRSVFNRDKVELLRKIVKSHVTNIYFQGISMAARDPAERKNPNVEEIVQNGFTGRGGCCVQLNYMLYLLLKTLGFDSYVTAAEVPISLLRKDHVVIIVEMSDAEKYLVDVGFPLPNYEIIPLHALPYRGIQGGLPFEFRYSEKEEVYQRFQLKGKYFKGDFENGKTEDINYFFKLKPTPVENFGNVMKILFTDPAESIFLRHTIMFRHFEEFDKMKFITIWGLDVLVGDAEKRHVKKFENYQELRMVIEKYFPKIDKIELTKALKCFDDSAKKNSDYE